MANRYTYFIIFLLSIGQCFAGGMIINPYSFGSSEPGLTYVGYPNTNGVPDSDPSAYFSANDNIATTKWVADVSGTAATINPYVNAAPANLDFEGVTLWKDKSGTITLIAQGTYTSSPPGWAGNIVLTAESGESLDFIIADILYFGGCGSSSNIYRFGRNDTGGTDMWAQGTGDFSSGPPSTITLAQSTGREMGFILGYE